MEFLKSKYGFLFGFLILSVFSCNKEDDESQMEIETVSSKIDLIAPNNSTEKITAIEFAWESELNSPVRFMLDSTKNFDTPIFDTLFENATSNFLFNKHLAPNRKFYWKISRYPQSYTAEFRTEDIISKYAGTYEVLVDRSFRDFDYDVLNFDTTYAATLEVAIEGDKIKLNLSNNAINNDLEFRTVYNQNDTELHYEDIVTIWRHEVYLDIKTDVDSLFILRSDGGPSTDSKWKIKTKKE